LPKKWAENESTPKGREKFKRRANYRGKRNTDVVPRC